jgi:endonuclease-3
MRSNHDPLGAKIESVHHLLLDAYGEPKRRNPSPPLDTLVGTILSQNTNDVNRDRAFTRLRERFPDWSQVRDAPAEEVIETIRSAGLANQKGPRIQEALRRITQERRELSLDFLADLPLEEARTWLLSLNGVGPKTAAIVLLFSLGHPAFPVDTHVHRVSRRLGLIGERTSAEKAHRLLEEWLPHYWYYAFHVNVIRHGRQVCHARKPRCEICVLRDLCDYYRMLDGTMAP